MTIPARVLFRPEMYLLERIDCLLVSEVSVENNNQWNPIAVYKHEKHPSENAHMQHLNMIVQLFSYKTRQSIPPFQTNSVDAVTK